MKRPVKRILIGVAILAAAAAAALTWVVLRGNGQAIAYRTAAIQRGDLLVAISATGTVEPEEVIDVGAQIAGQILSFGKDTNGRTVDYGSTVDPGMVLARIDDLVYAADAAQAEAQVRSGRAALQRARADLGALQARLQQAERDWQRARKLGPSEALAEASFDAYRSAYETAVANVEVGRATIQQSEAGVAQAEAALSKARRNLSYCTITSPVKGVIIDRRVNIGQTVVASLNAPSLFLIAKDLTRMQVWVAVNEADIGRIRPGQIVTFTVDAFPDDVFQGEVGKVRLNASMTQNVVTYTVEVITDNSTGRLLPYLTANVQFEMNRRNGVLMAPNSALRWTPTLEQVAPDARDAFAAASAGRRDKGKSGAAAVGNGRETGTRSTVWVLDGDRVRPIPVKTGLTDGSMTEVEGPNLAAGMEIVVGVQPAGTAAAQETRNPFAPSFRPRGPGGSGR
jgi:HlyD family secretion protein